MGVKIASAACVMYNVSDILLRKLLGCQESCFSNLLDIRQY